MQSTNYCPHCGAALGPIHSLGGRPLDLYPVPDDGGRVMRFGLGGAADTGATWQELRRPARPANVASDVVVPFLQASATAAGAALLGGVLAAALGLPWLVSPTAAALAFAGTWVALLRDGRAALWHVETLERGAPAAAAPSATAEQPRPAVRLAVSLEGGRVQQERELPIEADALIRLARAMSGGAHGFSERELTAAGLVSGRAQYEALRSVFLALSWLRWRSASDRRQGLEWTAAGRAGLRALADGSVTVEALAEAAA